eukprot:1332969-Rhodomonas_salina.1
MASSLRSGHSAANRSPFSTCHASPRQGLAQIKQGGHVKSGVSSTSRADCMHATPSAPRPAMIA